MKKRNETKKKLYNLD